MRVVAGRDRVIDMGPGAGDEGGRVVAAGTPEEVSRAAGSRTTSYLARFLSGAAAAPPTPVHSEHGSCSPRSRRARAAA